VNEGHISICPPVSEPLSGAHFRHVVEHPAESLFAPRTPVIDIAESNSEPVTDEDQPVPERVKCREPFATSIPPVDVTKAF
jgi:hypothetical protein